MKWKDHVRIAKLVAKTFRLPVQPFTEGAVAPDKFKEKEVYFTASGRIRVKTKPHHIKNVKKIMRELKTARKLYLDGRITELSYRLGIALHYIQDACTGKGFLGLFHGSVENGISTLEIPGEAIQAGLKDYQPHPFKLRKALKTLKSSNNPNKILWNATYYSFLAAKSVLELGDKDSAIKEAEKLNRKMKKSLLAVLPVNLAMLFTVFLTASVEAFTAFLVTLILYAIPLHFRSKKRELKEWFNLY